MIILCYIAVYNCGTYAHVSSENVSNVGMLFTVLIISQYLRLEIAIRKFFNNGYEKYLNSSNSVNTAENDSSTSINVEENLTNRQFFSFSGADPQHMFPWKNGKTSS